MDSQDKVFHALLSLPMMLTDKLLALTQELRQFGPFPSGDLEIQPIWKKPLELAWMTLLVDNPLQLSPKQELKNMALSFQELSLWKSEERAFWFMILKLDLILILTFPHQCLKILFRMPSEDFQA